MLIDICIHKKYSHLVLKDGMNEIETNDKAFISKLVYGTLQNYRYLDYQWKKYCEKLVKKEIEILINMSVYQLFYLQRVPDFAIINEAVEIAKEMYDEKIAKFVNAILRNVVRSGKCEVVCADEDEKLAIKTSFPLWIVKMWKKQYGEDICKKLCCDALEIPQQSVRVNTIKNTKEEFLANHSGYHKGSLSEYGLICELGSVVSQNAFKEGLVSIQDEASQMVAPFLNPLQDDLVLDMCSAPGSKTAHMAALMENCGKIIALDIHKHRIKLVDATMRRLGCLNVETFALDATKASEHFKSASFNKILLDAPCSGYGVLKGKSDIKYHMQSSDMDEIIKIQKKLIDEGIKLLKQDGIMVYSTCTLNKKENEYQIQQALERHSNIKLIEERTIFPFTYQSDGFYMAKLQRVF